MIMFNKRKKTTNNKIKLSKIKIKIKLTQIMKYISRKIIK